MANKVHIVRLLIVFSFLFLSKLSFPQYGEVQFEHITTSEGLASNRINDILQDSRVFFWFSTEHWLHIWDVYNMKVYQPDPNDSFSISDRQVYTIYKDISGVPWISLEISTSYVASFRNGMSF